MQHITRHSRQPRDEQALITLIISLENEIERAEGAKANLPNDVTLNAALRQLRRQRASYLSVLLDEAQPSEYSLRAA